MRKTVTGVLLVLAVGIMPAQSVPRAIFTDPAADLQPAASTTEMAAPSHGEKLLGIFYGAAGPGDHPTVVLLHGFPGYEQNLDLAQALRRAGWNVLALHYRGSWGVGGNFSLEHSMEDADAMVAWARSAEAAAKFHIDRERIVVIGHSMGGYMAAWATAHNPAVKGVAMIGTWDLTAPVRGVTGKTRAAMIAGLEQSRETQPEDFLPLRDYTPATLATEIVDHRTAWDLDGLARAVAPRPVLLLTANDGSEPGSERFEKALQEAGDSHVELIHVATDHPWSGKRIELETLILNWLSGEWAGRSGGQAGMPAARPGSGVRGN